MSAVASLCGQPGILANAGRTGQIVRYAVEKFQNFCELGAVSPDLPYLDLLQSNSKGWANVMHYWKTADIVRAGVSWFAARNVEAGDPEALRALAWFFGYSAHVATDPTVHPVLAASGFAYATNPSGHRSRRPRLFCPWGTSRREECRERWRNPGPRDQHQFDRRR